MRSWLVAAGSYSAAEYFIKVDARIQCHPQGAGFAVHCADYLDGDLRKLLTERARAPFALDRTGARVQPDGSGV